MLSLDNRLLVERTDRVDVGANSIVTLPKPLDLAGRLARQPLVLVKLSLTDSSGAVVSDNLYWQGRDAASQRRLNELRAQPVLLAPWSARPERCARAHGAAAAEDELLASTSCSETRAVAPALTAKITMLDAHRVRVLPVYYDDNYVTLLAGEVRHILVQCPKAGSRCARVALRGWNVNRQEVAVRGSGSR